MIIGEYSVNPLQVFYGRCECINNCPIYKIDIHIMSDDDIPDILTQYILDKGEADKFMKLIDKCINERVEAQLNGTLRRSDDGWAEDD